MGEKCSLGQIWESMKIKKKIPTLPSFFQTVAINTYFFAWCNPTRCSVDCIDHVCCVSLTAKKFCGDFLDRRWIPVTFIFAAVAAQRILTFVESKHTTTVQCLFDSDNFLWTSQWPHGGRTATIRRVVGFRLEAVPTECCCCCYTHLIDTYSCNSLQVKLKGNSRKNFNVLIHFIPPYPFSRPLPET